MTKWGVNHGVTMYGHIGAELITLVCMLRISVIIHNVRKRKLPST